jgi:hypothetical protein
MKPKILFLLSFIPAVWIGVLGLAYFISFNPVWFGVLVELITIPIIAGGIALLVLSLIAWRKDRFSLRSYALYGILLIAVSYTLLFSN